ncbi:MAG: dTMP kinase [Pseudomonadaceae bacterium]|nr:dTMP kinase [Pseudomonadaceae bacterium]
MNGAFITIEGSEGVGKTSNVEAMVARLRAKGLTVVHTREPGGTPLAEDIRTLLLDVRAEPMASLTELLLVFASRAQHLDQVIRPALARGDWVVCDRFTDATYAYQGGGRGLDISQIDQLAALVHGDLQPDLTIYLDLAVDVAFERIKGRDHDRFEREQRAFFESVRSTYRTLAERHQRYELIDASQPLPDVQQDIATRLDAFVARFGPRS